MEAEAAGSAAQAMSAAATNSARLKILEKQLEKKDAVMEPKILDRVKEYVGLGGNPQEAIRYLVDNYKGVSPPKFYFNILSVFIVTRNIYCVWLYYFLGMAQMVSLTCQWIEITEPPEERGKPT